MSKIVLELKNQPAKGDLLVIDSDTLVECVGQVALFKPLTDRIKDLEDAVTDLTARVVALEQRLDVQEGVE